MRHTRKTSLAALTLLVVSGCSSVEQGRLGSSEVRSAPPENRTANVQRVELYREPNAVELLDSLTSMASVMRRK